jgi:hypothetical protein
MSDTGEHEQQRRWGRLIRLSTRPQKSEKREQPELGSSEPRGVRAVLEKPEAAVRGILASLETRTDRFLASRHAVSLPAPVAGFAARAVLAFQACAEKVGGSAWGSFDVGTFARWLGKRENLHPAVVPDLFRALRSVFSWLVVENEIDPLTAQQIVEELEAREDEIVHGVIDRHLAAGDKSRLPVG